MDDDDRLRFLFHQAFERGMPTDDCPSAEELLDAYQHRTEPEERRKIVDHLAACSVCAEAWRLARGTPDLGAAEGRLSRPIDDATRERLVVAVRRVCPEWLREHRDDLVQMTAMKLLRTSAQSDWSDTYLCRVAYTVVVDEMRRRKRRREVGMSPSMPHRIRDSGNLSPESRARGAEVGEVLLECLGQLPDDKRQAVALYLQDHTVPEIAEVLGWERKRASNKVYRGLDDLRAALKKRGLEP